MNELGVPFQLTSVDGVPCFWADLPGPCHAGLLFRVGRADETLPTAGLTQLVQRLAYADGAVDSVITSFQAEVERPALAGFFEEVCHALGALPLDGLATERRVLSVEHEREDPGLPDRMLMMRFGAARHGLSFYEPMGVRWLEPAHVADWGRRWFTRGNAAVWMTCPPPTGLRLPLPEGGRAVPPEPQPIPGLELPSFAAAGHGLTAATMLGRRTAALTVAVRAVAERLRDADHPVASWQLPLTADVSHRFLAVEGDGGAAALDRALESVAADGPARGELEEAVAFAVQGVSADDAAAGGLERMAVEELLGAPRRWKEDLVREAQSASYAEAAAALREALGSQILLAPVDTPKPSERFADYPWFSRDRVQGSELKPVDRSPVRLVVSQEGVSHVARDAGHASTVRFPDVAAALQERDGSLTLIGRDGAIVGLDVRLFKGADRVVADLERSLPPELIVPPRDTNALERVARNKLRPQVLGTQSLRLLTQLIEHDEVVVNMAEATVGYKWGLLALTDRRVIFATQGPRHPVVRELPYADVLGVTLARVPSQMVTVRSPVGETAFAQITPKERAPELAAEIEHRAAAVAGGGPQ